MTKSSIRKVILSPIDLVSYIHHHVLLFIVIVIFMIIVTIFVIYSKVQWQVLRALLTPLGRGASLLFNVLFLHFYIYWLLVGYILIFVNNYF